MRYLRGDELLVCLVKLDGVSVLKLNRDESYEEYFYSSAAFLLVYLLWPKKIRYEGCFTVGQSFGECVGITYRRDYDRSGISKGYDRIQATTFCIGVRIQES